MARITLALLSAVIALPLAAPARAGLGDPIPAPFTKVLYSVPGIINDGVATVISCSSALPASVNVGVEWFQNDGTSLGVSSFTIPAGGTANFESNSITSLPASAAIPALPQIKSGAARVLSTTTSGVLCNAFEIDPSNDPPARMMQLLITGVKKQKGQ